MNIFPVVLFALALSLDGFGVGIAYGIRKIKIPLLSLIVISFASATAIGLSMLAGHGLARFLWPELAEGLGAGILIIVGLWILFQTWLKPSEGPVIEGQDPETELAMAMEKPLLRITIKPLGLVIEILREPSKADMDKSGVISVREAMFLGLALAMDALGAGFGAAMTGFKVWLTPIVVGMVKFVMVSSGIFLGQRYAASWLGSRAAIVPGWVLIILGLVKVYKF